MTYFWRQAQFPEKQFTAARQVGFIAQEIEQLYPEMVATDPDGYKSVDYSRLTPVLVEAIEEQQTQIEALSAQNAALTTQPVCRALRPMQVFFFFPATILPPRMPLQMPRQ